MIDVDFENPDVELKKVRTLFKSHLPLPRELPDQLQQEVGIHDNNTSSMQGRSSFGVLPWGK